nr:hypothetical protein [Tanacetum cinerariifolium]
DYAYACLDGSMAWISKDLKTQFNFTFDLRVTWGGRVRDWYYSSGCKCTVHCPGDDGMYKEKGREKELWFVRVWGLGRTGP